MYVCTLFCPWSLKYSVEFLKCHGTTLRGLPASDRFDMPRCLSESACLFFVGITCTSVLCTEYITAILCRSCAPQPYGRGCVHRCACSSWRIRSLMSVLRPYLSVNALREKMSPAGDLVRLEFAAALLCSNDRSIIVEHYGTLPQTSSIKQHGQSLTLPQRCRK